MLEKNRLYIVCSAKGSQAKLSYQQKRGLTFLAAQVQE